MNRQEILEAATKCVCGDRDKQYGSPEDSFGRIASYWNAHLAYRLISKLKPVDVAIMMALLKVARIDGGRMTDDSWIDLAGYAACGGELASEADKPFQELATANTTPEYKL